MLLGRFILIDPSPYYGEKAVAVEIRLQCRVSEALGNEIKNLSIERNCLKWENLQYLFELGCENSEISGTDFGNDEKESCTLNIDDEKHELKSLPIRRHIGSNTKRLVFLTALVLGMNVYMKRKMP